MEKTNKHEEFRLRGGYVYTTEQYRYIVYWMLYIVYLVARCGRRSSPITHPYINNCYTNSPTNVGYSHDYVCGGSKGES